MIHWENFLQHLKQKPQCISEYLFDLELLQSWTICNYYLFCNIENQTNNEMSFDDSKQVPKWT